MNNRNYNRKTYSYLCLFVFLIVIVLFFIGMFFPGFYLIFIITIPLLLIIIITYIVIRYSWGPQKHCPRCNIPVSVYADFCRNCGIKLINKCPNCDKYVRGDQRLCTNCGFSFEGFEEVKETPTYVVVEKGTPAPKRPNFCPTCGSSVNVAENLRFCEYCGSKLV